MRTVSLLTLAALVAAALGCDNARTDAPNLFRPAEPSPPQTKGQYLEDIAVVDSSQPDEKSKPTAVENALAWSEKYAKAVEHLQTEQQKNRRLADENRRLQNQLVELRAELAKAHKELTEANDLLIEVRTQNEKWKTDVLGFRNEMREAHVTTLEALTKVLKLLGGEVPDSVTAARVETQKEVDRDGSD